MKTERMTAFEKSHIMKTERMTAVAALEAIGVDVHATGPVKTYVMVSQGPVKVKRYMCRLRKRDGHVRFRWGRLVYADVTDYSPAGKIAVFHAA